MKTNSPSASIDLSSVTIESPIVNEKLKAAISHIAILGSIGGLAKYATGRFFSSLHSDDDTPEAITNTPVGDATEPTASSAGTTQEMAQQESEQPVESASTETALIDEPISTPTETSQPHDLAAHDVNAAMPNAGAGLDPASVRVGQAPSIERNVISQPHDLAANDVNAAMPNAGAGLDPASLRVRQSPSIERNVISQPHDLAANDVNPAMPNAGAGLDPASVRVRQTPSIERTVISQPHDLAAQDVNAAMPNAALGLDPQSVHVGQTPNIKRTVLSQPHDLAANDVNAVMPNTGMGLDPNAVQVPEMTIQQPQDLAMNHTSEVENEIPAATAVSEANDKEAIVTDLSDPTDTVAKNWLERNGLTPFGYDEINYEGQLCPVAYLADDRYNVYYLIDSDSNGVFDLILDKNFNMVDYDYSDKDIYGKSVGLMTEDVAVMVHELDDDDYIAPTGFLDGNHSGPLSFVAPEYRHLLDNNLNDVAQNDKLDTDSENDHDIDLEDILHHDI
ncbi:MAG: hypothetical protein IKR25_01040 [Muribaculaceae bacterium]|nr:hypothetical protein [Muribaculaceae bacterium]